MNNPTEPIQPIQEEPNTIPIPERLQAILDTLTEYHRELLLQYSHFTQSPNELFTIETLLREKAKLIKNYLLNNKIPPNIDPKLKKCLEYLKQANTPWDPEISILIEYWCDLMFIKHPFTLSHNHIQNLLKNYLTEVEDDTELPTDED